MEEIDFGFFFCRVASHYSMPYLTVMDLPLKVFWLMNRNIDRMRARNDAHQLTVAQFAQATPEGVQEFRNALVIEAGTIVKTEDDNPMSARLDSKGLADLKAMSEQTIG